MNLLIKSLKVSVGVAEVVEVEVDLAMIDNIVTYILNELIN